MKFAPETYKRREIEYQATPVSRIQLGYKKTTNEPVWHEFSNKPTPLESLEFRAEMPESVEKYGLKWLPNPANQYPKLNPFSSQGRNNVEYDLCGGFISDHWGIRYSLLDCEVAFRFDLTTLPAEVLTASLQKQRQVSEMERAIFDVKEQTEVSTLNMLWSEYQQIWGSPKNRNPHHEPRYIEDSNNKGIVHLILDRTQPLGPQWKTAKRILITIQKELGQDIRGFRCDAPTWRKYLRILDARDPYLFSGEPVATYEEIGKVILGKKHYNTAKARAKQDHDAALHLMCHFPQHPTPSFSSISHIPG